MEKQILLTLADRVEAGEQSFGWGNIEKAFGIRGYGQILNSAIKSLDAAKKLHDAVLPGAQFRITTIDLPNSEYSRSCMVHVEWSYNNSWWAEEGNASTPAAAWVAAILRAKAAQ